MFISIVIYQTINPFFLSSVSFLLVYSPKETCLSQKSSKRSLHMTASIFSPSNQERKYSYEERR